jgi:hypothetical protein
MSLAGLLEFQMVSPPERDTPPPSPSPPFYRVQSYNSGVVKGISGILTRILSCMGSTARRAQRLQPCAPETGKLG